MSQPLVSVIIPCYRQFHLLGRAIRSCLDDPLLPIEIIVVNDGSPGNMTAALAEFCATVRLIRLENSGPSAARNAGIDAATGRFVKFLDADDWLLPGSLSRQVNILQQEPEKILVTGYRFCYEDEQRPNEDCYPNFGFWQTAFAHSNPSPIHAYLLSRDLVSRIGYFDASLRACEDYDYWLRSALLGIEAIVLQSVECVYYRHKSNATLDGARMRKGTHMVWKHHAGTLAKLDGSFLMRLEFLKASATMISYYPNDPSFSDIATSLLHAVASKCNGFSMREALDLAQAIADVMVMCPDKCKARIGNQILEQIVQQLQHLSLDEFESHMLQIKYFSAGQALLKSGNRKMAERFFLEIQRIGKNYGVNYPLLARIQSLLSSFMPGAISVAVFLFVQGLVQSYWKYIYKVLYETLCAKPIDKL